MGLGPDRGAIFPGALPQLNLSIRTALTYSPDLQQQCPLWAKRSDLEPSSVATGHSEQSVPGHRGAPRG